MIQITTDNGRNCSDISAGLPARKITRVIASGHDINTLYVSLSGFRQTDGNAYLFSSSDLGFLGCLEPDVIAAAGR